jgi:hypothetical protein
MGYYTKAKEIVGWGAPPNTTCGYCSERRASVLVVETYQGYPMVDKWSCNECTPAHSCPDHISNKLGEVMSAILANSPT